MKLAAGWRFSAALAMFCLTADASATEVRLTGVQGDLRQTLLANSLVVEETREGNEAPSSAEVLAAAQADYRRLLATLYDSGFFGASISIKLDGREAASFPAVSSPAAISTVAISVDPGAKFRFGRVSAQPIAPKTKLPPEFKPGETASLGVLKQTVADGVEGWREQGHAKAKLASQELTAQHSEKTINADLRLEPGPRLRFGALRVVTPSAVRTQRILDIAGLPTGKVFSPAELDRAADRLRRTGAFSAVALLEADKIGPNATLPINAELTDQKPRRFGFGAELATEEGLTLSAFWLHRNLLGGAERFRVDGEIAGLGGDTDGADYKLSARFDRPATFNEDTHFYALAKLERLDEPLYRTRKFDLEAGIKRIASPQREYRFGVGLHAAKTRDALGERSYRLLTLPTGLTFDYRDKPLDAKKGYYLNADFVPFATLSGGDSGLRGFVDARFYRTFGETRPVTFALRGQVGALWGAGLSDAPADFLFYSGGGGTVRGQPYQSLGVELPGGETVGGRSFVGLSAELRMTATKNIGIVGFADAGYIGESEFFDGSGEWHSGAGLGLRYSTPIGPIRFDLAAPVSGKKTGKDFQIYLGIGQSF